MIKGGEMREDRGENNEKNKEKKEEEKEERGEEREGILPSSATLHF
jgi:hypothetical protein